MKSWLARNIWPWSEIERSRLATHTWVDVAFKTETKLHERRLALLTAGSEIGALRAQLAADANGNVKRGARGRFVSAKS